jgi:hypothetical protein
MRISDVHSDRVVSSARTLIQRVVRILRCCGLSDSKIREIVEEAMPRLQSAQAGYVTAATAHHLITCSDLVLKWRRDSRFLTAEGLPCLLSLESNSPSFRDLVRVAAPQSDPIQLLETMKELGVVRTTESDGIELISESVVACSGRDGLSIASEPVLEHVCGFLGSVEYNLLDKPSRARGRFERACYASVPQKLVPILEKLVRSRGQDFVDVIDEWLARRAIRPTDDAQTVLVGAGAYVFVRENVRY